MPRISKRTGARRLTAVPAQSDPLNTSNPFAESPKDPAPSVTQVRERLNAIQVKAAAKRKEIQEARKELDAKIADQTKELCEVEQEEKNLKNELESERNVVLLNALTPALVDALAPNHDRTSCSDTKRADENCARCALLNALAQGYIDFTWAFRVERDVF